MEDKKKEIEAAFAEAIASAKAFNEDLMKMRDIKIPLDDESLTEDEKRQYMALAKDLDMRTAFILRSILVQHGNVLWL